MHPVRFQRAELCRLLALGCGLLALTTAACRVYEPHAPRGMAAQAQAAQGDGGMRLGSSLPSCRSDGDFDADSQVAAGTSGGCALPHARSVCLAGQCVLARCDEGFLDCDQQPENGCESAPDDIDNCGQCLHRCEVERGTPRCEAGSCRVAVCEAGWGDCDSDPSACETRLDNADHCGACDASCARLGHAAGRCEDAHCAIERCDTGYADCDGDAVNGCEQALDTLAHCGACNAVCDKASCSGGRCTNVDCDAQPGRADCDGDEASCEVDLTSDPDHCGACEHPCRFGVELTHAAPGCREDSCEARCEEGYGDCDGEFANGCEQQLSSVAHCGRCDNACSAAHGEAQCVLGRCELRACDAGYADCDADGRSCESSLSDAASCGACGVRCDLPHTQARCSASSAGAPMCELEGCEAGWDDCDGLRDNGCERDVRAVSEGGAGPCYPDASCSVASLSDHHYYFCNGARSWQDARRACTALQNADLAQLRDAATRDFLRTRLTTRMWIGHNDLAVSDVWVWANSGVPFWQGAANGRALGGAFTSWASGEPNRSGACGALFASGDMDDLTCSTQLPYVCEVAPDACPSDPNKTQPGQCGCGVPDVDANRDGFAECPD